MVIKPELVNTLLSARRWRVLVVSRVRFFQEAVVHMLSLKLPAIEAVPLNSLSALDQVAAATDVILIDSSSVPADVDGFRKSGILAVMGLDPDDQRSIVEWVTTGATVLIPDSASGNEIVEAVCSAARGEVLCPATFSEAIIREGPNIGEKFRQRSTPRLTVREAEIAVLLGRGHSNQEIAERLSISISTVKNHVHSILKRLRVRSRGDAARLLQVDVKGENKHQ